MRHGEMIHASQVRVGLDGDTQISLRKWLATLGDVHGFQCTYHTTSSASTVYMNVSNSQMGVTLARGHLMPFDGSVVAVCGHVDVNAYGPGDCELAMYVHDGSTATQLLTTGAIGVTGVANGVRSPIAVAAPGVHTFDAGDVLTMRRFITTGTLTTDDINALFFVKFDPR